MKTPKLVLCVAILSILSCRERNSIFDIGGDDFALPPAFKYVYPTGLWIDGNGNICGVRYQIDCMESFKENTPLLHVMYINNTECKRIEQTVDRGKSSYYIDFYHLFLLDVEYDLIIYFGEFAVGSCAIIITSDGGNNYVIRDEYGNECRDYLIKD